MGSGFEQGRYSRQDMVITIDELRQADKHPSTFYRPQLEAQEYDPRAGQPLDWRQAGREGWQWHQREKAGMRIGPPGNRRPTPDAGGDDATAHQGNGQPRNDAGEPA